MYCCWVLCHHVYREFRDLLWWIGYFSVGGVDSLFAGGVGCFLAGTVCCILAVLVAYSLAGKTRPFLVGLISCFVVGVVDWTLVGRSGLRSLMVFFLNENFFLLYCTHLAINLRFPRGLEYLEKWIFLKGSWKVTELRKFVKSHEQIVELWKCHANKACLSYICQFHQ